MKTILLYGFDPLRDFGLIRAVKEWAEPCAVNTVLVSPEQYSLPLEKILDSSSKDAEAIKSNAGSQRLEARMLVFSEFDRKELFAAIDALKPLGMGPDVIKVSVTPTNRSWSGYALCREVVREHKFMKSGKK